MHNFKMNINEYLPLRDVVFYTLRQAILKGELEPGERLMEMQLAEQLGVSRTPIREAIRMLEQEGLAITIPRKGAEVAKMTEKDMEDVLQIRAVLEELAVRLSCQKITAAELTELQGAMEQFVEMSRSDDIAEVASADVNFHDVLYKASDNPKLLGLLNNLREQMYRYRVEYLKDIAVRRTLADEHRSICEALRAGDETKALDYIRIHIDNQQKAIIRSLNQE